ncbi:MAG: hypothetical protein LCH91_27165 [Bacteroidetes bacterium]|nr:hypothetical protein [Bacteroidota bacterium]
MKKQDNTYLFILLGVVVVLLYLYFKDRKLNVTVETNTPPTTTTGKTANEQTRSYSGTSTHNGTGTATSFSVPHLLGEKPVFVQVTPTSGESGNYDHVEYDTKLITVFYKVAPPEGTNNVTFNWFATL